MNDDDSQRRMDKQAEKLKKWFFLGIVGFVLICAIRFTVEAYGLVAVVFWVGAAFTAWAAKWHMSNAIEDSSDATANKRDS